MKKFTYTGLAVMVFLTLFQCSLFEPRDNFEEPIKTGDFNDVFSFKQILDCPRIEDRNIRFLNAEYNELFSVDFVYHDVNAGLDFDKNVFVDWLDRIESPLVAKWSLGSCTKRGVDTIFIRQIKYQMKWSDSSIISGQSDFEIVRNRQWEIVKWVNYPSEANEASKLTPLEGL